MITYDLIYKIFHYIRKSFQLKNLHMKTIKKVL